MLSSLALNWMAKQQERVGSLRLRNVLSDAINRKSKFCILGLWFCPNFSWVNRLNKSTDTSNTVLVALREIRKGKALLPVVKCHSKMSLLKLLGNYFQPFVLPIFLGNKDHDLARNWRPVFSLNLWFYSWWCESFLPLRIWLFGEIL